MGEIKRIQIPKGASKVDLSDDDLTPQDDNDPMAAISTEPPQNNASIAASVHIPTLVFWARALAPFDPFPELTVVHNTSPTSSRSNTVAMNGMG